MTERRLWHVGTAFRYVLVSATDADDARRRGWPELYALYTDARERVGGEVPIDIVTVRHATDSEIELQRFHDEMSGLLPSEDGCPMCGERSSELLIWIDDDDVRCHACGTVYQPIAGPGSGR